MRVTILSVLLGACFVVEPSPPPLPVACQQSYCILDHEPAPYDGTCCDSVICYLDERTNEWQVVFCDPPAPLDPCTSCIVGEICVQRYDGTCQLTTSCEEPIVECPANACSVECEQAYCSSPYQCQNRSPCGGESALAFTCYGP